LPGRGPAGGFKPGPGYTNDVSGWMTQRPKMGGKYRLAPVMTDRLLMANQGPCSWFWKPARGSTYPLSSHRGKGAIPTGVNFLFEDGSVGWRNFIGQGPPKEDAQGIAVGLGYSTEVNYILPTDIGTGPW